jgi:LytTr DNA-binding domain
MAKSIMWGDFLKHQYINWRLAYCITISIYGTVFVQFLKPHRSHIFGYTYPSFQNYVLHTSTDIVIVILSTMIALFGLPKLMPRFFPTEHCDLNKFILLILISALIASLGIYCSVNYFVGVENTGTWFIEYMFGFAVPCLFFLILPFTLVFLAVFNAFKAPKEPSVTHLAETGTGEIVEENDVIYSEDMRFKDADLPEQKKSIPLHFGENTNRKGVDIYLDKLYYISSDGNYVEVFFENEQGIQARVLLRNSLKTIEEELMSNTELPLLRCHKSFIVNMEKVLELRGNSKIAHLILKDIDKPIPVSRQKFADLEAMFM